jgi:ABC-2 type transport system ATP-binding protein
LPALAAKLRTLPAVEQVASFGAVLHVTGSNRERLKAALEPFMDTPALRWREVEPGLEDVFIHLMRNVGEKAELTQ